ncbi:MAG: hypothetical protein JWP89_3152 [Schlesneria sp.]|nr:hypothetical protein [Schlesneria sp.]
MNRIDLLALAPDDLASLTNRGTVKRAQKELEEQSVTCAFREDGNDLICEWSDGIVCRFPAGKTIHDAICSSGIVGISRHIIRSVLAYQQQSPVAEKQPDSAAETTDEAAPTAKPKTITPDWNPGHISDDQLIKHFRSATIAKARQRYEQGVLVELILGPKPLARFLDEPCTVRFLVPGDVRYVSADCSEALLGTFVPLAVWAFRQLEPDRRSGIVSLQQKASDVPVQVLDDLDSLLSELCVDGIQGTSATWPQRLTRQEASCRDAGLPWLAELLVDLLQQREMYASHDALFEPQAVPRLTGELIVRSRAIRSGTTAVPQLLIRGTRSDRTTELPSCRLIGLGCGVRQSRRAVTVTAYLQDADAGSVVGVDRTFADPAEDSTDPPRDFTSLGQLTLTRGVSLTAVGMGQLLIKSAKRTPAGRLVLPRTASSISLNPQAFAWEHLRPPLAVEGFAELAARLELLPPSSLRPRRLTEALHVCAIERFDDVGFDIQSQRLVATAVDGAGEKAHLFHPFTTRGRTGFESLSAALSDSSLRPRFVCGHVSRRRAGVWIEPTCVVFEAADGKRRGISPWTDARPAEATEHENHDLTASGRSPLATVLQEFGFELSELLLNGIRRAGPMGSKRWARLGEQVSRVGLNQLGQRMRLLSEILSGQSEQTRWEPTAAVSQAFNLLMLSRLSDDIPLE